MGDHAGGKEQELGERRWGPGKQDLDSNQRELVVPSSCPG